MKALVAHELNRIAVETVTIDPPKAGELLIQMKATGVCHSDLSIANGTILMPFFPMVLGHEGAGIVQEVGPGVTGFAKGDHVILSFVPSCGQCYFCQRHEPHLCAAGSDAMGRMLDGTTRVHRNGSDVNVMQFLGCMAEYAVVPAISAVKIDKSVPFDRAALIGCGVMTGVGGALKTAEVKAGSTVAVFGCGGIGLSVIQGAKIAGARQVIGVDLADSKLEYAKQLGATHTVNAATDPVAKIRELTGGIGVDYAFEAIGIGAVMTQAFQAARRGGTVCILGLGKITDQMPINAMLFAPEAKKVIGSFYGNTNFRVDMPLLAELYQQGKLDLDRMVTKTYSIDQAPQAFEDLEQGKNARGVIVYP